VTDTLRVVTGPTAAGKSAVAMHLAAEHQLAVISADSRQIYRQFDIGTAKPSPHELAVVPHAGIDILEPTARYSAHAFAHDATMWMVEARSQRRTPLIVGGTGFYIRALVSPFDAGPELDHDRRTALEPWLAALSPDELTRWARRLDPARAHLGRTQRLRAIETALLSGLRLSDTHRGPPPTADRDPIVTTPAPTTSKVSYLVVDPGPILADRIERRVHAMASAGWFEEVEALLRIIPPDAPAWNACGYGTIRSSLEGRMTRAHALQQVVIETRQYAKRQRTWCRHQLHGGPVTLLDPDAPDAMEQASAWFRGHDAGAP
jgi:tRNA dimethylallyltransferase